jgi:hypothetical protein
VNVEEDDIEVGEELDAVEHRASVALPQDTDGVADHGVAAGTSRMIGALRAP